MPRPNRPRTIGSEATLAERIANEREQAGLTYEGLAKAMTDVGCPVDKSAIYRIEKGEPRRKVSVDEVVALMEVFGLSFEELLMPIELVHKKRAQKLVARADDSLQQLTKLAVDAFSVAVEVATLANSDPDLAEYVRAHAERAAEMAPGFPPDVDVAVVKAVVNFLATIREAAAARARGELDPGDLRPFFEKLRAEREGK